MLYLTAAAALLLDATLDQYNSNLGIFAPRDRCVFNIPLLPQRRVIPQFPPQPRTTVGSNCRASGNTNKLLQSLLKVQCVWRRPPASVLIDWRSCHNVSFAQLSAPCQTRAPLPDRWWIVCKGGKPMKNDCRKLCHRTSNIVQWRIPGGPPSASMLHFQFQSDVHKCAIPTDSSE